MTKREPESPSRYSMRWFLWTVPSWIALILIVALLLGAAPLIDIGTLLVVALILMFWISLDISDKLFAMTNAIAAMRDSFISTKEVEELVRKSAAKGAESATDYEKGYGKK